MAAAAAARRRFEIISPPRFSRIIFVFSPILHAAAAAHLSDRFIKYIYSRLVIDFQEKNIYKQLEVKVFRRFPPPIAEPSKLLIFFHEQNRVSFTR